LNVKRMAIVLFAVGGLVLAFAVASSLYEEQRVEEVKEAIESDAGTSILERDYSQTLGPSDARVTIVEFFDPGCETCRIVAPHVKNLLNAYPGKVRLVLRYVPLHQGADTIVKILEAARRQGKYWEALHVMFESQPQWASHHHPQPELIWQFLPAAELDLDAVRRDMEDPEIANILRQDIEDARALGVRRTPTFFVNGRPLLSFGLPQLAALVQEELAAAYPE